MFAKVRLMKEMDAFKTAQKNLILSRDLQDERIFFCEQSMFLSKTFVAYFHFAYIVNRFHFHQPLDFYVSNIIPFLHSFRHHTLLHLLHEEASIGRHNDE